MTEIPADWTLITAGNGRTYWTDYVEGQKYPRSWRGLDDGYRFNDAEILIMGPARRAVVVTEDEWAEAQAAKEAVEVWAGLHADARAALASVADRLDEHTYSELSAVLGDEPFDQHGERYRSEVERRAAERALREVAAEIDTGSPEWCRLISRADRIAAGGDSS